MSQIVSYMTILSKTFWA